MSDNKHTRKSVRFDERVNFHPLYEDIEVKNYRKKYWELLAIDRYRLKRRIDSVSKVINPILNKCHRMYIYNKHYNDLFYCIYILKEFRIMEKRNLCVLILRCRSQDRCLSFASSGGGLTCIHNKKRKKNVASV